MASFLEEYSLLMIGLAGTTITFLIFLTEKVLTKQRLRLVVILATIGFLILVAQQVSSHLEKRNDEAVEKAKQAIIGRIDSNVSESLELTKEIYHRLNGQPASRIGVELSTFRFDKEVDPLLEFEKSSPEVWRDYSDWLLSLDPKAKPCLSITVNADHNYKVPLLLAYILTNQDTKAFIEPVMDSMRWYSFPNEDFASRYFGTSPDVEFVLFYDRTQANLVGFANAALFAKELLLYQKTGKARLIENVLNGHRQTSSFLSDMKRNFLSFSADVIRNENADRVAEEMLNREIGEILALYHEKVYSVSLAKIIEVASSRPTGG